MGLKNWIIKTVVEREVKKMLDKFEGKKSYIVNATTMLVSAWLALAASPDPSLAWVPNVPPILVTILGGLGIWARKVAKPKA